MKGPVGPYRAIVPDEETHRHAAETLARPSTCGSWGREGYASGAVALRYARRRSG